MKRLIPTLVCLLLGACSSRGFNRGALRDQVVEKPVVADKNIGAALKKKANLPRPFRLGIFFKTPPSVQGKASWRWSFADKELFLHEIQQSELKKNLAAVTVVAPVNESESLKDIRLAAARQGIDAVLVVSANADLERYLNPVAWTYLLVIPAFFAKGSQADAVFVSQAMLWDVRNEFLYLSAESETERQLKYPFFVGPEDKDVIAPIKDQALRELAQKVAEMVRGQK